MEKFLSKKKKKGLSEKKVPIQKQMSSPDANLLLWGEEGGCFTQEVSRSSSLKRKEKVVESKFYFLLSCGIIRVSSFVR
jgi:hypothetical protein